jgi:hypothetical protein
LFPFLSAASLAVLGLGAKIGGKAVVGGTGGRHVARVAHPGGFRAGGFRA